MRAPCGNIVGVVGNHRHILRPEKFNNFVTLFAVPPIIKITVVEACFSDASQFFHAEVEHILTCLMKTEHSSNGKNFTRTSKRVLIKFWEQWEQRPNFASTFKSNETIDTPTNMTIRTYVCVGIHMQ